MELSNLIFKVDYSQVTEAATGIKGLGAAVTSLNKPLAAMEKASSDTATATEKVTKATKETTTVLQRQKDILEFMTQGFSKGQASTLAQAKAAKTLTTEMLELQKVLLTQRKLQGGDPFDKSNSGLIALKNQYTEVKEAMRQYVAQAGLTSKQTRDLARDKERVIEAMKAQGSGFKDIRNAIRELNSEYVDQAAKVNKMVSAEKELERQHRDSANAARFLAKEEERIASVLETVSLGTNVNAKTSERAAVQIANYAQRLKQAGINGTEAAARLDKYRASIIAIQRTEEKRKVDQLSRSLTPQISDVTVSLAGGMNPLTVLLQQGLQVRDLIAQSGVGAAELQKAFKTAASDMVGSIKNTAGALGSLFIGSIQSAGAAVTKFAGNITGTNFLLDKMRVSLAGSAGEASKWTSVFNMAAKAAQLLAGGALVAVIGLLVGLAVGLKNVIAQENELARTLAFTGASLGLSQQGAIQYARSLDGVAGSTSKALTVITAMAKEGGFLRSEIATVTKAAVELEKYGGVAIEDTIKSFAKLKEKPVEALQKLALETGLVAPEVIKAVYELEKQGKTAEATAVAIKTLAEVNAQQVKAMKEDYNGFSLFIIELGSDIKNFFSELFKDMFYKTDPTRLAASNLQKLNDRIQDVKDNLKFNAKFGITGDTTLLKNLEEQARMMSSNISAQTRMTEEKGRQAGVDREILLRQKEGLDLLEKTATKEEKYLKTKKEYEAKIAAERASGRADADVIKGFESAIAKAKKDYEDEKNKRVPKSPEESFLGKSLKQFTNNTIEAAYAQDELSKSQLKILQIVQDPLWDKLKEDQKLKILATFQEAYAAEQLNKVLEVNKAARAAALKEDFDLQAKRLDQMAEFDIISREANIAVAEESKELMFQASLIGKTIEERKRLIEVRKIEIALEKELETIRATYKDDTDLGKRLEEANRRALERIANVAKQTSIEAAQQMQTALSDAIETALFEGGKAGSKKLRDIITAELRKPIRVWIEATVKSMTSGLFGGSSGSGGIEGGVGIGSSTGGGLGGLSSLSSAYDLVSGALNVATSAGQGLATMMAKTVGQFGASTFTTMTTQFASGMMSTGSMAAAKEAFAGTGAQLGGLIVGSVMNGISGYGISKSLSGGYSTGGDTVNIIAGIASMIPGIGPIAGVVGGLVNRAFGRKAPVTTGQDIRGTFGTTGADVAQYQTNFSKGGWFRSNKTTVTQSAVSAEFDAFLDGALKAVTASTKGFARVLGLVPETIDGVTQSVSISLLGLNAEQQQAAITKALGGFGDKLAENLLGTFTTVYTTVDRPLSVFRKALARRAGMTDEMISKLSGGTTTTSTVVWTPGKFVNAGETAGEALSRLATRLLTVNGTFDTLNQTLLQSSLIGGDAASKLIDAFGSTEIFTNLTTAYYNEYYTAQEKVATTTRQLTSIFGNMGLTLPTTRDAFRDLLEAQDLYTDEGRATYAALLNLSPAFASITSAVEEFTNSLIDEVRRLRGEIVKSSGASGVDYLKQQFLDARTAAQGGDATALAQLPTISQALEEAAKAQANSAADIVRIQAWLAQGLATTSGVLGQPIPAFAAGGMHTGGARIVGENGPELEVTGPSRIYSAGSTMGMLGGASNEMLAKLNDNITGLRAEVRADVAVNAKTAKLLDRVIPEGDAIAIGGIDGGIL